MIKRIVCASLILLCAQSASFGVQPLFSKQNEKAPDFKLFDLSDSPVALSDFHDKPIVLFFWTTWCPYCREALKQLDSQYAQLQQDGIIVLPIDVGEPKSKVEAFARSNKLALRIFLDKDSQAAQSYDILGVPTYILIDRQGMIRSKKHTFPHDDIKDVR